MTPEESTGRDPSCRYGLWSGLLGPMLRTPSILCHETDTDLLGKSHVYWGNDRPRCLLLFFSGIYGSAEDGDVVVTPLSTL